MPKHLPMLFDRSKHSEWYLISGKLHYYLCALSEIGRIKIEIKNIISFVRTDSSFNHYYVKLISYMI